MVSVERVLNYCKVPQEASLESEGENKPPNHWPAKGNIEVNRNRAAITLYALPTPFPPSSPPPGPSVRPALCCQQRFKRDRRKHVTHIVVGIEALHIEKVRGGGGGYPEML